MAGFEGMQIKNVVHVEEIQDPQGLRFFDKDGDHCDRLRIEVACELARILNPTRKDICNSGELVAALSDLVRRARDTGDLWAELAALAQLKPLIAPWVGTA